MKTRIFPCFSIVLLALLTLSLSGCGTDETTPIVETNDGVNETPVVGETLVVAPEPEPDQFRPVRTLKGHTDWGWSVAFSPDGGKIASGDSVNTIRLWGK